eukprot:jgi/Mesvir1/19858/Mv13148-RA.1
MKASLSAMSASKLLAVQVDSGDDVANGVNNIMFYHQDDDLTSFQFDINGNYQTPAYAMGPTEAWVNLLSCFGDQGNIGAPAGTTVTEANWPTRHFTMAAHLNMPSAGEGWQSGLDLRGTASVVTLRVSKTGGTDLVLYIFAESESRMDIGAAVDPALYAWYDPSDGSTLFSDTTGTAVQSTAGGNVLRMNDKKNRASGYHVTQSNSAKTPILDTTELNGKTSLRFINLRSGLLTSSSTFWGSIGTKSSVVIVAKQLTTATYPDTNNPGTTDIIRGFMIGSTMTARANRLSYHSTGPVVAVTQGPGTTQLYVAMASRQNFFDNQQHVLALSVDTVLNTFRTRFDGRTADADAGANPETFTGNLAVGGDTTNAVRAFDGWIGEILIYNTAKTSAELELIRGYLVAKWGTPATPPP